MDFNLNNLRAFLVVARTGSLSAAAQELKATQPNLGRQMTSLANELGMTLFVRHSRGVVLTEQGQEFFDVAQRIVCELEQEATLIREKGSEVQGLLKILTGTGSGQRILSNLKIFSKKYPNLRFKFSSVTDISQIKMGDADVGIVPQFWSHPESELIQHHLYDLSFKIYASPEYLKKHPKINKLEDLQFHQLISYHSKSQDPFIGIDAYLLEKGIKSPPLHYFMEVNNGVALRSALVDGFGVGSFWYDYDIMKQNLLVDVFPNLPSHKISFYYVYHPRLENVPKIVAFHEYMKEICKPLQEQ